MPIFIPDPVLHGGEVFIWGRVRPAHASTRVSIQWRSGPGRQDTVAELSARGASAVLAADVHLPGPGQVRLAWRGYASRWVSVSR